MYGAIAQPAQCVCCVAAGPACSAVRDKRLCLRNKSSDFSRNVCRHRNLIDVCSGVWRAVDLSVRSRPGLVGLCSTRRPSGNWLHHGLTPLHSEHVAVHAPGRSSAVETCWLRGRSSSTSRRVSVSRFPVSKSCRHALVSRAPSSSAGERLLGRMSGAELAGACATDRQQTTGGDRGDHACGQRGTRATIDSVRVSLLRSAADDDEVLAAT